MNHRIHCSKAEPMLTASPEPEKMGDKTASASIQFNSEGRSHNRFFPKPRPLPLVLGPRCGRKMSGVPRRISNQARVHVLPDNEEVVAFVSSQGR